MIHKMHAFIPLMIGMRKMKEIKRLKKLSKNRYDLLTPRNAFEEYSRWERRWKVVSKENHPIL